MKARMTALWVAALVCVMALLPTGAMAVSNVSQLTSNPATGQIYFGNDAKTPSAPALYRYVYSDTSTITLFYHGENIAQNEMGYDSNWHKKWSDSAICLWLNGNDFLNNTSVFTTAEKDAMNTQYSTIQENDYNNWYTFTPNQTIVLPSVPEVTDNGTWSMNQAARKNGTQLWWLRTPGNYPDSAARVKDNGDALAYGSDVYFTSSVRPAFKLNLSSVLFTSAAENGKSVTLSADLQAVTAPGGTQKLTILSSGLSAGTVTAYGENTNAGTTIKVSTTGATANKSLSAIIVDNNGVITHYGKIADTSPSGTVADAALTLPVTLGAKAVLKILTEEINGNNLTDYAGVPVAVNVVPAPQLPITITPTSEYTVGQSDGAFTVTIGAGTTVGVANLGAVSMNNQALSSSSQYTATDGSIILTLAQSYLNTLPVGTHTLKANITSGTFAGQAPSVNITVKPVPTTPPKTGDGANPLLWLGLCLLGGAGLMVLFLKRKQRA